RKHGCSVCSLFKCRIHRQTRNVHDNTHKCINYTYSTNKLLYRLRSSERI
uniref:Uncharacterized protein n=1 Tax=Ciona intestinalis TaxID=7719 RepID=H2XVE3_CIOIN